MSLLLAFAAFAQEAPPPPIAAPSPSPVSLNGPHWSGEPDLCVVVLSGRDQDEHPVSQSYYRILEEGAPPGAGEAGFAAAQERRCAATMPGGPADPLDHGYFMLSGAETVGDGVLAVRLLRLARHEAAARSLPLTTCHTSQSERLPDCNDPARAIAALDLATLDHADILIQDGRILVEGMFSIRAPVQRTLNLRAALTGPADRHGTLRIDEVRLFVAREIELIDKPPPPSG